MLTVSQSVITCHFFVNTHFQQTDRQTDRQTGYAKSRLTNRYRQEAIYTDHRADRETRKHTKTMAKAAAAAQWEDLGEKERGGRREGMHFFNTLKS